jgi:uncharacterized protein (DUF305 family)
MRVLVLIISVMVALVLVAGCATGGGGSQAAPIDQQFIDMMVPHHQGAVEMAKIARQRAERPEIREMAGAIIAAQDAEIATLKGWRRAWFGSDQTPPMDRMPMLPGMSMPGHNMGSTAGATMDMAADVAKLRAAGAPLDKAFIDAMIPHHESAIAAAAIAREKGQRAEITELAARIIADQQREVAQMRQWRQAWFGSAEVGT